MIVDWEVYYDAARRCRQLAADLRAADKPVHEAVRNQCAGMAGDANGCKQWGESYDHAAHHTLQASASLANALTNYAAILAAQGYNWGIANRSNPPPPHPDTTQVADYRVDVPTSVRDNGSGFAHSGGVKAFFDQLVTAVANRFGKLPNADAGKLYTAHTTWTTFANHQSLTGASATIAAVSELFEGMDDPVNRQLIQDHFATLKTSAENVAVGARSIADPVGQYHSATVSFGQTTANKINWLEAGVAAAAVAGVALAIFTVGMSAEAAGASIAAAVSATTTAIEEAFTASTLAEILGVTTLTLGAVVTVKAFQAVPVDDLERDASKLAAIIAMKVLIDEDGALTTETRYEDLDPAPNAPYDGLNNEAEEYVKNKHVEGGREVTPKKSTFSENEDLPQLADAAEGIEARGPNDYGNYEREVDAGREIGNKSKEAGGQPTSRYVVITDRWGAVLNMFPV